ncbi:pirin family protein [uncultured Legionella sp.]|uniref:pirin family protein n=1 Tax=uncultured Legionella sp. TaxID=210934 RepID=UPI0026206972|nr:pirin family protein [uncultured Legionella sp.]
MIVIRKSADRGKTHLDWLYSLHTFSFADYYDPEFMGFSVLRVINEDSVQAGKGFGRHSHQAMEIISYVIDGELEHKDSIGNGSIIRKGDIQLMSAGTGIAHSEFNHSATEPVHFLQIWIIPQTRLNAPGYQQQPINKVPNQLLLIVSGQQGKDVVSIHQNVDVYAAFLDEEQMLKHVFHRDRCGWLQLIKGTLMLNGYQMSAGDGASITQEQIEIKSISNTEFILFDLP